MKTWITRTLLGLGAAAVLAGGLAACAGRDHGRWAAHDPQQAAERQARMVERVGRKLDLDAAQTQRLQALAEVLQAQRAALLPAGTDPRAQVRALVAGPAFDLAGAQALLDSKLQVMQSGGPQVLTAMAAFYDGLNPQQQQTVREFMARSGRH